MNTDIIKGNWKQIKGMVKKHWGEFTDDEITKMQGAREELEGALQKKYGYNKEKAANEVDAFVKKHGWDDKDPE